MRALRFGWLWLVLGWVLVGLAIAASLAPIQGGTGFGLPDKLLHGAGYFGLMVWFSGIYRPARYPLVAAALLALGIALEFAQGASGVRFFEVGDMVANGIGIAVGWLAAVVLLGTWCQHLEERLLPRRAQ